MFWWVYDCSLVCIVGLLELVVFLGFAFVLFAWGLCLLCFLGLGALLSLMVGVLCWVFGL